MKDLPLEVLRDLPLEVLRDLWLARFGAEVTWDVAVNAANSGGERHWIGVYTDLANAGYAEVITAPLRIVLNQEKM
jgi:hypothetical protein